MADDPGSSPVARNVVVNQLPVLQHLDYASVIDALGHPQDGFVTDSGFQPGAAVDFLLSEVAERSVEFVKVVRGGGRRGAHAAACSPVIRFRWLSMVWEVACWR